MRTFGGIRCFMPAGDVLLLATGKRLVGIFAKALDATHEYLHTMRAKVAPTKSFNFASHPKATMWLRDTFRGHIKDQIEVVTDFTYLGAHLTTRAATNSSTMD